MERNDASVLSALKDLQELEVGRRREEAAARARLEAAEAEAREKVRKEAEARRAEEARQRAEAAAAEASRRDAEASHHMERLRAELAAVQADRQRLQERILDPVIASATPAPSGTRRGVVALLGLVTVCSLGLAAALALRPPTPVIVPAPVPAPAAPDSVAPIVAVPAAVATPTPVEPGPVGPAASTPRPRPGRPGNRPGETRPAPVPTVDPCENSLDPTCGLDEGDAARRRSRPGPRRPPSELPQDL